jgi:hypothetical protein
MAERRPLVLVDGVPAELPVADTLLPRVQVASLDQIAGINPTLDLDFVNQVYRHYSPATGLREKDLSDIVTFTRASTATYFDAKGTMQTAASGEPRIDFDPETGECKGLLIEESRVNSFLNSLIDGTSLSTQTVTVTAAPWTISVYGTGSITLSGAHSATMTGTSETTRTALTFTPTAGSLVCTVSGTVKWAQCELGGFATSFIPTAGSTATRAADVAKIDGTAFTDIWNQNENSIAASFIIGSDTPGSAFPLILAVDSGSTTNRIVNFVRTVDDLLVITSIVDNTASFSNYVAISYGAKQSYCFAVKDNDSALSVNAEAVIEITSCTIAKTMTRMFLGYTGNYNSALNGQISRVALFPRRLTNTQLQQLGA